MNSALLNDLSEKKPNPVFLLPPWLNFILALALLLSAGRIDIDSYADHQVFFKYLLVGFGSPFAVISLVSMFAYKRNIFHTMILLATLLTGVLMFCLGANVDTDNNMLEYQKTIKCWCLVNGAVVIVMQFLDVTLASLL